jgi:hypothetical protein
MGLKRTTASGSPAWRCDRRPPPTASEYAPTRRAGNRRRLALPEMDLHRLPMIVSTTSESRHCQGNRGLMDGSGTRPPRDDQRSRFRGAERAH